MVQERDAKAMYMPSTLASPVGRHERFVADAQLSHVNENAVATGPGAALHLHMSHAQNFFPSTSPLYSCHELNMQHLRMRCARACASMLHSVK